MKSSKSPSTPRMASEFKKSSSTGNGDKPDRIFKKEMHKRSSYEGVGVSEITLTQSREFHLARKINQYYKQNGRKLADREQVRLEKSTLQTHLKYGPPHAQQRLENHYRQQAESHVDLRRQARLNQVDRISKRMQWRVVEKSRVMRERQKFKQEQKNYLSKQFGLSVYKPSF